MDDPSTDFISTKNLECRACGPRIVHSDSAMRQSDLAASLDRMSKVGKRPLRLVFTEGTGRFGHFRLSEIFARHPELDRVLGVLADHGYDTLSDLDGSTVGSIFGDTNTPIHEQRRILDTLLRRISSLVLAL